MAEDCPPWASAGGADAYGRWAELSFDCGGYAVSQRLRWIAPGTFWMGSPEGETGRSDDEGPRHEVTISSGSWLFDTPLTQFLWTAVMGDNPAYFRSPRRPADCVSFWDVQCFLARAEAQLSYAALTLPSEAEWEFACRAGTETETATYAGDLVLVADHNAPEMDGIAWYSGNGGIDFDLDNGESLFWATGRQYEFETAGAHPVKQKAPNRWGLYDMLGNVWERCADAKRTYRVEGETDPVGPMEAHLHARRGLRGGSYNRPPTACRSAYRGERRATRYAPYIGFRCKLLEQGARLLKPAGRKA